MDECSTLEEAVVFFVLDLEEVFHAVAVYKGQALEDIAIVGFLVIYWTYVYF